MPCYDPLLDQVERFQSFSCRAKPQPIEKTRKQHGICLGPHSQRLGTSRGAYFNDALHHDVTAKAQMVQGGAMVGVTSSEENSESLGTVKPHSDRQAGLLQRVRGLPEFEEVEKSREQRPVEHEDASGEPLQPFSDLDL